MTFGTKCSNIVDYHYLGDPIEATSRLPKALDEVMALYAGKRWVHRNVQTAQIWGNEGYVIEPRYVGPILEGIGAAGLTVSL